MRIRHLLPVAVAMILSVAASWAQGDNQQKFRVTGGVVNRATGEPVRGALVEILGPETRSVMTGADGRFEIDGLTAGQVYVMARRPGFAQSPQPNMTTINASTQPITIRLSPFSKISGRVLDRDSEPIESVTIQCLREQVSNGRKQWLQTNGTTSDETGRYSIEDLPAGIYILRNIAMRLYRMPQQNSEASRYIYPSMYYPDAPTREMAQRIELAPGEEMKADMTLRSMRGARVSFTTVPHYPNTNAVLSSEDTDASQSRPAQNDGTGGYVFGAVAPGSWKIVVRGLDQQMGQLPIEVGSSDIDNLKLPLGKLSDIAVVFTGGTSGQPAVELHSKAGPAYSAQPDQSGALTLHAVEPGSYKLVVHPNGAGCVASVLSGSQDLIREELVVSAGGTVAPIQITQTNNCAQLTVATDTKSIAAVLVTNNLAGFESRWAMVVERSSLPALNAGEYKIYAFDDITDLEYANPEAMRGFKSQTVQLEAGQQTSVQVEINQRHAR